MGLFSGLGSMLGGVGNFLHNHLPGLGVHSSMPLQGLAGKMTPPPGLASASMPKMMGSAPRQMWTPGAMMNSPPQNPVAGMGDMSIPQNQPLPVQPQVNPASTINKYMSGNGALKADNIKSLINQQVAQSKTSISPQYFDRMAQIESGYNPTAQSPTGAKGLFQFTGNTWKSYGNGNPLDPVANTQAAIKLADSNNKYLQSRFGRAPSPAELYMAHNLGPNGAARLLSADPNTPVTAALIGSKPSYNPMFLQGQGNTTITARQAIQKYNAAFAPTV